VAADLLWAGRGTPDLTLALKKALAGDVELKEPSDPITRDRGGREGEELNYREICERLARGEEFCADTAEGELPPEVLERIRRMLEEARCRSGSG